MEEIKDPLLEEVIAGIGYSPITCFLVKPLDTIMVSKDITTMKPNGVKDEASIENGRAKIIKKVGKLTAEELEIGELILSDPNYILFSYLFSL